VHIVLAVIQQLLARYGFDKGVTPNFMASFLFGKNKNYPVE